MAAISLPIEAGDEVAPEVFPAKDYAKEPGDEFFTDAVGDIYARKPDGRVYDLTD